MTLYLIAFVRMYSKRLQMEAPVRQITRCLITVDNPLPKDATITFADKWWNCDDPNIRVHPVGSMTGKSEGVFEVRTSAFLWIVDEKGPKPIVCFYGCA